MNSAGRFHWWQFHSVVDKRKIMHRWQNEQIETDSSRRPDVHASDFRFQITTQNFSFFRSALKFSVSECCINLAVVC